MTAVEAVQAIILTRSIKAPASQVYKAFTNRDWLTYWFCDDAHVRTAVGGHLLWTWNTNYRAYGEFTALEENKKVAFTWRGLGEASDSLIEVGISEDKGVSDVTLTITGYHPQAETAVRREFDTRLGHLVTMLETGVDRRITDRVIIGIYPAEFNEEIAARLNVPSKHGMRVGGVIENYGAQKAGLQADDVIVEIDGKAVTPDMPSHIILGSRKPGDQVSIAYYRGGQKHTATLPLTGYPVPEIPADFPALADELEKVYASYDAAYSNLFAGLSEEEGGRRPEPKEWSIRDNVAHLILAERWLQAFMGGMIEGGEVHSWSNNTDARVNAVSAVYPTNAAILDALRRAWKETVTLLRTFPREAAERKASLWWAAFEVDGMSHRHLGEHVDQISKTLNAIRAKS